LWHSGPDEIPRGFTLIELLIVVAIIAILAAIAVPNFLQAQTRAKVSRVRADMRTVETGVNSYYVDHNAFPTGWMITVPPTNNHSLYLLSSPVSYLSNGDIQDAFQVEKGNRLTNLQWDPMTVDGKMFSVFNQDGTYIPFGATAPWYLLWSIGPDLDYEFLLDYNNPADIEYAVRNAPTDLSIFMGHVYDPTNGTTSRGNLWRAGGTQMNEAGRFVLQTQ